jgi:hypothetical protein
LGEVVTPDQQRQYQQGLVAQIRNIMQQAQAARSSDLPGAKSLAGRAEVLAKDLVESFR